MECDIPTIPYWPKETGFNAWTVYTRNMNTTFETIKAIAEVNGTGVVTIRESMIAFKFEHTVYTVNIKRQNIMVGGNKTYITLQAYSEPHLIALLVEAMLV